MSGALPAAAADLVDAWFLDALSSPEAARRRTAVWFGQSADFDRMLTRRFGHLPARARAGELVAWTQVPRGALAVVLALDQLPRNLYRGTPDAYAFDRAAQAAADAAVAAGFAERLHPLEAAFLFLPFEHAEDPALQARCVAGCERQLERAPAAFEPLLREFVAAAREHQEIIRRFGRFPHRNAILGREPTAGETAYLADGGKHFGQQPAAAPPAPE